MDWPGAVFPTGLTASKELDAAYPPPSTYRNKWEENLHESCKLVVTSFSQADLFADKVTDSDGLPLCVQVVGPRLTEERTLTAAMLIEEAFKKQR
jgi:Asp-tRNA(Asn)/Glu-tRNA(Gln) amidotransferase A subunit family amidase